MLGHGSDFRRDVPAADRLEVVAVERDESPVGAGEPVKQPQQRGLPRAVGSEQSDGLPLHGVQGDAVDDQRIAALPRDIRRVQGHERARFRTRSSTKIGTPTIAVPTPTGSGDGAKTTREPASTQTMKIAPSTAVAGMIRE